MIPFQHGFWPVLSLSVYLAHTERAKLHPALHVCMNGCKWGVYFTSLYFCSVLASLVSHASTVFFLLRRAGSRSCRSAGGSVARLASWAEKGWGQVRDWGSRTVSNCTDSIHHVPSEEWRFTWESLLSPFCIVQTLKVFCFFLINLQHLWKICIVMETPGVCFFF